MLILVFHHQVFASFQVVGSQILDLQNIRTLSYSVFLIILQSISIQMYHLFVTLMIILILEVMTIMTVKIVMMIVVV